MRNQFLIVGLIVLAAFLIRTLPYLDTVFTPHGTAYMCPDPWYQMRLVDNMLANFPQPLWHDAYAIYPDGAVNGYRPIMTWLISSTTLLIGFGNPSPHLADMVGAYLPAVVGALTIIPVYIIGAVVFKRKSVGVIAAVLAAFLPTEFFHRGMLGFTDHHILEVFLSTLVLMFFALAWKRSRAWYGLPAGICLGLYLWNWHGSFFFAGFFTMAFLIAFLVDYMREPWHRWLMEPKYQAGIICFAIAAVIYFPLISKTLNPAEFAVAGAAMAALPALVVFGGSVIKNKPLFLGGMGLLIAGGLVAVHFAMPWLWDFALVQLRTTFWGFGTTIREVIPMGPGSILTIYGLTFLFAVLGIVFAIRYKVDMPLVIWSIIIILANIGERRWGYYATINISLFSVFFVVLMGRYMHERWRSWVLGVTTVALLVCVLPGITGMMKAPSVITQDWQVALQWVRNNTPDPFGDDGRNPSAYYEVEPNDKPSYAVLSWWDYGHFIIRDARRVPVSSPTYQETVVGWEFFIAQSEAEADEAIDGCNIRYIMIDRDMVEGKFYAMVLKSGQTTMTLGYWRNSMAYRLYYGLIVGKYRAVFITPTVKVFEVFG